MTMSMKQIHAKVTKHLLNQGEKSQEGGVAPHNTCVYRSSEGLSCAVGCLIPDDKYNVNLEGQSAYDDDVMEALVSVIGVHPYSVDRKAKMLGRMQYIHDLTDPSTWEEELDALKVEFEELVCVK